MTDKIGNLLKHRKFEDFQALAKLLTAIDQVGVECFKHAELLQPPYLAFRVGITGPPGAGKSTLIAGLIQHLRQKKLKVAVLAVDPSSPFSQGALLGDRIRYQESLQDQSVFVRSIGSRGSHGGLSASSYLMLRAFDTWQFDIVIIETVGVGQTELEIMNVADHVSVVLVPESGDGIQVMKAGLMEIAQSFIVNKSDRPGAESLKQELKRYLEFNEMDKTQVFSTVATEQEGLKEIVQCYLQEMQKEEFKNKRSSPKRLQAEAEALLKFEEAKKIQQKTNGIKEAKDFIKLFGL